MYQQNYGYYPQTSYTRNSTPTIVGLKGRPVSSIEEARVSAIDFDGSVFYFPDLANKRIGIGKKPTEALDVAGNIKSNRNVEGVNLKCNALYVNGVKMIWYE